MEPFSQQPSLDRPEVAPIHLPTEKVLRILNDIAELKEGDNIQEDSLKAVVYRSIDSFATWDTETCQIFIINLLKKQSAEQPSIGEYMERKEVGYVFANGIQLDEFFLERLPLSRRLEVFWGVLHELSKTINFSDDNPEFSPWVLSNFISSSKRAFNISDWRKIELELVTVFANDPEVSSDAKYQAISGYLSAERVFKSEWEKVKSSSSPGDSLKREHSVHLQEALSKIVVNSSLEENFRSSLVDDVHIDAISEESRKAVEKVLLSPGEGFQISDQILHWLQFRTDDRPDKGKDAYGVIAQAVNLRSDLPLIQLKAMGELLSWCDTEPIKREFVDMVNFTNLFKKIYMEHPQDVEKEGISFFTVLGHSEEGKVYLTKFLTNEDSTIRILALAGSVYNNKDLITGEMVRDVLQSIISKFQNDEYKEYIIETIQNLCNAYDFETLDKFLLIRLKKILEASKRKDDKEDYEFHSALTGLDEAIKKLK